MPNSTIQVDVDATSAVVYVIQSSYHYRDQDNYPKTDEVLEDDEGWFADAESAAARCDQLNAPKRTHYENVMASEKRDHGVKIELARQKNREAAVLRAGGIAKTDVKVPKPFEPDVFEAFLSRSSYTVHEPVAIRRSDHDGLVRASIAGSTLDAEPAVEAESGVEA